MNGFLAWLQSVGHTLKGWVGFMTPDEWIVLGMVIAALALAMTGTSVTRSVKRKRRVRRADTKPSSAAQEKEKPEQPEPGESAHTQKDEKSEQQTSQETANIAKNQLEEPAAVIADNNLSVEVGRRSSEMVPALEEGVEASIEAPLSSPSAPSIAVSYDANAQKQSRSSGARREDIASLTGGGDPVAAKLNLARVYSDTGDSKEAQQLLQEVLKEGSEAQQRAAKGYLEKLQQREDT